MKKYIPFQAILLALILFIPGFIMAGDRYVSTTGSNITGNGTAANPWRTVQFAVDNSVTGDVIHIAAGTYIESNILVNKTLTITGEPGNREAVVMAPAAEDGNADNAFSNNAQNGFVIGAHGIILSNLTINGRGNPALTTGKNNYRAAIVTLDPSQVDGGSWNGLTINNIHVQFPYRRGISVFPRSVSGTVIENCNIEYVAYNHAIYLAGQGVVRNNIISNCFQGIVLNPDASTPPGLIEASANFMFDIGNFPGCWGDLGGGSYSGQPRGIEFDNASGTPRTVKISFNTFVSVNIGINTVGIYTRLADEFSLVEYNSIYLGFDGTSKGILIGWSYTNGFLVRGNNITMNGAGSAIHIFGSGSAAKPVYLEGNIMTSSGATYTDPGEGTGIAISNKYLDGTEQHPSYVIIRNGNSITDFSRGIDVMNLVPGSGSPALTVLVNHNTVAGNTRWGLVNTTGTLIDATGNWWGRCSGPFHPVLNPGGQGNAVSNDVNFIPWDLGVNAYDITGGGAFCEGGSGVAVGLSGSDQEVNYQLFRNGLTTGQYLAGTGGAVSFGLQTLAGTYTVLGYNTTTDCSLEMSGTAVITVGLYPAPAGPVTGQTIVQQGQTGVAYSVSPIANATSYNWILPPGANITSGGGNSIVVAYSATAVSDYIRVQGINDCGSGSFSTDLFINVIPTQNNVNNVVVRDGEIRCFNAVQVVNVAGNGDYFLVQDGGQATFIAGQMVFLLPGTVVEEGGKMRAYITTDGYYCAGLLPPAKHGGDEEPEVNATQSLAGLFKVYPNPTAGRFTIELHPDVEAGPMTMVIFGMRGEIVMKKEIPEPAMKSEFTLEDRQPGIYIIRLKMGDRVETAKIIRLQ